jgi:hypothetical protein
VFINCQEQRNAARQCASLGPARRPHRVGLHIIQPAKNDKKKSIFFYKM